MMLSASLKQQFKKKHAELQNLHEQQQKESENR